MARSLSLDPLNDSATMWNISVHCRYIMCIQSTGLQEVLEEEGRKIQLGGRDDKERETERVLYPVLTVQVRKYFVSQQQCKFIQ